jgi:RNA polymerase-binding transcription factor DksA
MHKESKSALRPSASGSRPSDQFHLSGHVARRHALKDILTAVRDQEIQTIKHLVRTELGTGEGMPGAERGQACRQPRFTFHGRLITLSEIRLAAIWAAFDRLEQGRYGLCIRCGNEISVGRLHAVPMAQCCFVCCKDGPTFGA